MHSTKLADNIGGTCSSALLSTFSFSFFRNRVLAPSLFVYNKRDKMEQQVAVWYKGSLALYKVSGGNGGLFNAELIRYNGPAESSPPREFPLHKEGRRWLDDNINQDLLDDIGKAIEIKTVGNDQASNPRIYNSGRPG